MNSRIQTTIETTQSTVILISPDCVFTTQLQAAIENLHLNVVRIDPLKINKEVTREKVRILFQTSYVCVWVDIPIFVSQSEKESLNATVLSALQNHLRVPLHLITFDALYKRKNGREGEIPTIASARLHTAVLKVFPAVACFSYSHVVYPFEGGVSIVQRFLLEKIGQGNRFPLSGSWNPLWYYDAISHFVTTLYDLSIKGGVFFGSQEIDIHSFELALRKASHKPLLAGKETIFPFEFSKGNPIGKTPLSTMIEELSLVTIPNQSEEPKEQVRTSTVFAQRKKNPGKMKRQRKIKKIFRSASIFGSIAFGLYLLTGVVFFSLLGNVRSIVSVNVQMEGSQVWQPEQVTDLARKTVILEKLSSVVPFPYSLVGISLPREGVAEGLRNLSQFISGIETYHQATKLLTSRVEQASQPDMQSQISSRQITSLFDESYKDLSAIQADITKGNPIFDSLFGIDGLSTQIVVSTISLRESITQEKAVVSLVDSLLDKQGKSVFLIVSADSTNARPLFGIPTQVVVVTIENGKIISSQSYQVSDLDQMLKGKVSAPAEMQKYFLSQEWKLSSGSWSADGPTAAREIAWFVSKQLHIDADTVLVLDSQLLASLPVEKNSASSVVLGASTSSAEELLPSILKSLNTSQAVLFSRDNSVAKTAKSLAWDGSVRTPTCPSVFTVDRECSVLTRYVTEYDIRSASDSGVHATQKENQIHEIRVSREMLSHIDTIMYPKSSEKTEQKVLKYLVDQGAHVVSVTVNGTQLSSEEMSQGEEYAKTSLTFPILLSSERQTVVVVSYTTPSISTQKSAIVFFAQKQPGKNADPLTVEFTFAKEYNPSVVAPKAYIERSRASFTTSLDTSKLFAVGF